MTLYTTFTGTEQEDQQAAASQLASPCYQSFQENMVNTFIKDLLNLESFFGVGGGDYQ